MPIFTNMSVTGLLLCSFLLLSSYLADGVQEDILLTREEENEIDNQLRRFYKPAVKTVKTTYGDLYDCVDFYRQPAFDNPLLKNHTYNPRMRPSGHGGNTRSKHGQVKFNRVDCPSGTIPIRRVTREELVRTKLHEKRYSVLTADEPGVHYAIVRTKSGPDKKYRGGSARISAFNVTIKDNAQYSLARMRIQSGTDSIEVGIMTNPAIYNTLDTHLFVRVKTSTTDKFNLESSFVQVDKTSPVDLFVHPVTERGVNSVNLQLALERSDDGNWWFYLNEGASKYGMGYWPSAVFSGGLQGMATSIDWGGEVSGPVGVPSAPMASSACPTKGDPMQDGYCYLLTTMDEDKLEYDAVDTEILVDSQFYNVIDKGIVTQADGHVMFYGGPGGAGAECT